MEVELFYGMSKEEEEEEVEEKEEDKKKRGRTRGNIDGQRGEGRDRRRRGGRN